MSKNELKQIQSYIRRAYDIWKIWNMEAISWLSIELEKYLSDYVIVKIEKIEWLMGKRKNLHWMWCWCDEYEEMITEINSDIQLLLPNDKE